MPMTPGTLHGDHCEPMSNYDNQPGRRTTMTATITWRTV
jgi:hypothetical protein